MGNISLTSREKKIIAIICKAEEAITVKSIAQKIGVSSRTILRDMKTIEKWFETNGKSLIRKPRVGVVLKATVDERKLLEEKLLDENVYKVYSPDERQTIISAELLQKKQPIKLFYFSNFFDVSTATVSNDLNNIESFFQKFSLCLERKPGYGVRVLGKENDLRRAMIHLLYNNLSLEEINDVLKDKINPSKYNEIQSKVLTMIDQSTLRVLQDILNTIENTLELNLADSAYIGLLVHLSIAIKRIKNKEEIIMDDDFFNELKLLNEFSIAKEISKAIEKSLEIKIPFYEVGYITMHLKGSKLRNGISNSDIFLRDEILGNYELTKIVQKMLKIVYEKTGYDLVKDETLLIGLVSHLRPAISRIKMNMIIRNPLLDEIKKLYPDVYQLSKNCIEVIEQWGKLEMPDSEIGFIAMHLGAAIEKRKHRKNSVYKIIVACASGIGTSSLLASKLSKNFDNIEIVKSSSARNLQKKEDLTKIDLVISTIEITNLEVPVVVVSPLLLEKDQQKILKIMDSIEVTNETTEKLQAKENKKHDPYYMHFVELNRYIYEVLNNYFYYPHFLAQNKKRCIKAIATRLFSEVKVAKSISKILIRREKIGSTVIGDMDTMLLHGKSKVINHLYFGVVQLREPLYEVVYDTEYAIKNLLIMLAPEDISKIGMNLLNYISMSLLEKEALMQAINSRDHQRVYDELSILLNDYMRDQINKEE